MHHASGLVFLTAAVVGCGPRYSKLKVDKIQSIAVAADNLDGDFCAYKPAALRALILYKDGKRVQSAAPGESPKGRVRASEFQWSSNHGAVDADAVLLLPEEVLAWFDEPITVSARVAARPDLSGEATLRPRFDCGGTLDLTGAPGSRGGELEDGGPGAAGPDVTVALGYVDTQRSGRMVLVRVETDGEPPEHYIVDPQSSHAPFVIDASGGAGGRGGQGMAGVAGTPGRDGEPGRDGRECGDGSPGRDGTDGQPGGPGGPARNGGPGGNGGSVLVRYDARFPELPSRIQVRVEGGDAGEAGQGGAGGSGGRAGRGGAGGKAGPTTDPNGQPLRASCAGTDGVAGRDGVAGSNGGAGPGGEPGVPGSPGAVREEAADAAALFADEIARGLRIVKGAP